MNIKKSDIEIYLILGGIGIAAYFLLPPIFKLLSIPGAIVDAPGQLIDKVKQNTANAAKEAADILAAKKAGQTTTIPGITTDQLSQWVDQEVFIKYDNTPIRSNAKSNASIVKYLNTGDSAGFVYSAGNEVLGGKNKTWLWLCDAPGSENTIGWIPLTDVKIPGAGIGCASCNNNVSGCGECKTINSIVN